MQRCLGQGEAPPGRKRGTTLWSFISVYTDDIHQELGAKPRLARSWGSPGHLPGRGTRHPTWTEGLVSFLRDFSQSPLSGFNPGLPPAAGPSSGRAPNTSAQLVGHQTPLWIGEFKPRLPRAEPLSLTFALLLCIRSQSPQDARAAIHVSSQSTRKWYREAKKSSIQDPTAKTHSMLHAFLDNTPRASANQAPPCWSAKPQPDTRDVDLRQRSSVCPASVHWRGPPSFT